MKKLIGIAALLSVVTLGFTGCYYTSANSDTRTYDVTGFTGVNVSSAFEAVITQSSGYSVTVTAPRIEQVQVEKQGNILKVWREGNLWFTPFQSQPKVEISLPELTSVELSGASRGEVSGFDSGKKLDIILSGASNLDVENVTTGGLVVKVSGASRLEGNIKSTGDAEMEITGASTVNLEGYAQDINAEVSGASRASLGDYYAKDGDVTLSGASKGTVNLTGRLDADVSGASDLSWKGSPTMGNVQTSGASSLHKA